MRKSIKKEHKEIVKYMRRMNNNLKNDSYIGAGRFYLSLVAEKSFLYEDGSGCYITLLFKIIDRKSGNYATFVSNNYAYCNDINLHTNDFLIRCSSGSPGHFPPLDYAELVIEEVIPYHE